MERIMLCILIVITIIYGAFTIWATFLAKKQIAMSVVDMVYCMILGGYTETLDIIPILSIGMILLLWLILINVQRNRNLKQRNRNIIQKNRGS